MGELGDDAVAVIDRDRVAVARSPSPASCTSPPRAPRWRAHRGGDVDPLVRPCDVQNRMRAHRGERAGQPALRRHDRGRGRQPRGVQREAVGGFLERGGQQIGPSDQGVEIHPDLAGAPERAAGVRPSMRGSSGRRCRRPAPGGRSARDWPGPGCGRRARDAGDGLARVARRPLSSPARCELRILLLESGGPERSPRVNGHVAEQAALLPPPGPHRRRPPSPHDRRPPRSRGLRSMRHKNQGPAAFRHPDEPRAKEHAGCDVTPGLRESAHFRSSGGDLSHGFPKVSHAGTDVKSAVSRITL